MQDIFCRTRMFSGSERNGIGLQILRYPEIELVLILTSFDPGPHCNFQTWQTFQYAKDVLTEQYKSLT